MILGWYLLKLAILGEFQHQVFRTNPRFHADKYLDLIRSINSETKYDHLPIFMRTRLSLKMFLRSFPRDKTCPRANGDAISPFTFYAPLSCHGRQGSKIAFYCQ